MTIANLIFAQCACQQWVITLEQYRQNVSYLAWRDIISLVSWSAMVVVVVMMLDPDWSGGI